MAECVSSLSGTSRYADNLASFLGDYNTEPAQTNREALRSVCCTPESAGEGNKIGFVMPGGGTITRIPSKLRKLLFRITKVIFRPVRGQRKTKGG
jgi:hypothetical protein